MRVVVAPDCFPGMLSAPEAAAAIAEGWSGRAPRDVLDRIPLSDGGAGFLDAVQATLGGELLAVTVSGPGPGGAVVPAAVLGVGDTAYVEAAQAVGPDLVAPARRDPGTATSHGVGELLAAAVAGGARRLVVGVGDSLVNDGGAGLLAALGAVVTDGPPDGLRRGADALTAVQAVDLGAARRRLAGVELVAATATSGPLAGPGGASLSGAAARGAVGPQALALDAALSHWGRVTDQDLSRAAGAGAGGGLGHALLLLGARRVAAFDALAELTGLPAAVARADLVVTGAAVFDHESLAGSVVSAVAALATRLARPTVVLAGRVEVGRREMAATGVEAAYPMLGSPGGLGGPADPADAAARPAEALAALAARVARTWSR